MNSEAWVRAIVVTAINGGNLEARVQAVAVVPSNGCGGTFLAGSAIS
jgi:hypothetical protein